MGVAGGILERLEQSLEWHSSPIDWCESNYAVTSSFAEFYNTASNAIFVVLPCLLLYLFHPFARSRSWRIQFVWFLTIVIGISSAYFHATLSLAGQLLDEFGILWVIGACIAFWTPRNILPKYFHDREDRFELLMLAGSILLTFLGCLWPLVNSFVLMSFSLPCAALLRVEMVRCRDALACFVARKAIVLWLAAVVVWLSDRFACGAWRHLSLPGGHWLWHLLVGLASYQAIVFIVYAGATKATTHGRPVMRLWPSDDWRLMGVAYVQLKAPLPHAEETNGNLNHMRSKNC